MQEFGINLVSSFTKPFSLTYVASSLAESLLEQGVPLSLFSVDFAGEQADRPIPEHLAPSAVSNPADLRHPITLYVIAATQLLDLLARHPVLRPGGRIHVANLWWELTGLPAMARVDLWRFDALLTHSNFIASLAQANAPGTHVMTAPLRWRVDSRSAADRSRFDLSPTATAFLFAFDADSEAGTIDPATGHGRKNPFELIDAFRMAFPEPATDVQLVLRATHLDKPAHAALKQRLQAAVQGDARIRILSDPMQFADLMSLTASCDVYVSLHRAEGLGLGMLEAMALGKPVIATAWSGNLSFMTLANSCLVRCRIAPLPPEYRYFGFELPPGTVWAEPIKEDAAAFMRLLHRDRGFREAVGRSGRASYEAHQAAARAETWIDELRVFQQTFPNRPSIAGKYSTG